MDKRPERRSFQDFLNMFASYSVPTYLVSNANMNYERAFLNIRKNNVTLWGRIASDME